MSELTLYWIHFWFIWLAWMCACFGSAWLLAHLGAYVVRRHRRTRMHCLSAQRGQAFEAIMTTRWRTAIAWCVVRNFKGYKIKWRRM
jgi:hypothetical protein